MQEQKNQTNYVEFEDCNSDPVGGPRSGQAHKVTTPDVTGEQGQTNLQKADITQMYKKVIKEVFQGIKNTIKIMIKFTGYIKLVQKKNHLNVSSSFFFSGRGGGGGVSYTRNFEIDLTIETLFKRIKFLVNYAYWTVCDVLNHLSQSRA